MKEWTDDDTARSSKADKGSDKGRRVPDRTKLDTAIVVVFGSGLYIALLGWPLYNLLGTGGERARVLSD